MKTVKLFITPSEGLPGNYDVLINGEGFHQFAGKRVGARLRGDDEWLDDTISFHIPPSQVSQQGTFGLFNRAVGSQLNEDWGRDEIYAIVEVEGAGSFTTNNVNRHF